MKQGEIDSAVAEFHKRKAMQMGDGVYMTTVVTGIRTAGHFFADDDTSVVHSFVWYPLGNSSAKRCEKSVRFEVHCDDPFDTHGGEVLEAGKEYHARFSFIVTNGPGTLQRVLSESD